MVTQIEWVHISTILKILISRPVISSLLNWCQFSKNVWNDLSEKKCMVYLEIHSGIKIFGRDLLLAVE